MQSNPFVIKTGLKAILLFSLSALIFASCSSKSGPVADNLIPTADIVNDTLLVTDFEALSLDGFTGKFARFPIGEYNDALFGDVESIAYLKPTIYNIQTDTVLDADYTIFLDLVLDTLGVYGDETTETDFALYSVTDKWRGNEFRQSTKPSYDDTNPVATFSFQGDDSTRIELSGVWQSLYRQVYNDTSATRDSTFTYDFNGLVIAPLNGSTKISFPIVDRTRFILLNAERKDTVSVGLYDWAFGINSTNANPVVDRLTLKNTMASFYNLDLTEELDGLTDGNLLKAELILYEDTQQLEATLPTNHQRLERAGLALKNGYTVELDFDLFFGQADATGIFDEKINAYRFDITSYVNKYIHSSPKSKDVYLYMMPSGGLLRSTILYDTSAPDSLKPRLIISTVK